MRLPWKQNQPGRKSELVMWEIRWETLSPGKIKKTAKTVRKLLQKKFVWCVFIIESHHSHGRGEVVKFDWKLFLKWKVPQGGWGGGGRGLFFLREFSSMEIDYKITHGVWLQNCLKTYLKRGKNISCYWDANISGKEFNYFTVKNKPGLLRPDRSL